MAYRPVPIGSFGKGLNLRDQPDVLDPAEAIDLLNVTMSERGAVRSRDGYAKLSTVALTNTPDSIGTYETSAGTKRLVVGNGNRLDVFDTFPGATAANVATTASPHFFARFGGPTAELLFVSNGTDPVRQLSGNVFSAPAGLAAQTGRFVAVWQNRLVVARESGATAGNNPSSVTFSAPADPTNFTAVVYEDLHPGDGEAIMGLAVFREQLIVFKQTKFFVFYGIGTDAAGEADPSWRAVEAGVGLAASRAIAVARDGVYFLDRKGVYKTTGQEPVQVSSQIDPFFTGGASPYFRSSGLNASSIDKAAMGFHQERLYLSVPTGTASVNDRMLVFDPRYGWWSLYDIPAAAMCVFRPSSDEELVFAAANQAHIARHAPAYTADNMATDATGGTAISSRWRSGWLDFGDPNTKTVRESKIWGEGKLEFRLTRDFLDSGTDMALTFGSGTTDTWGGGTGTDTWGDGTWGPIRQIQPRLVRQARRGTLFSVQFSHNVLNESWAVHRMSHNLRDFRVPSVTRSEVAA